MASWKLTPPGRFHGKLEAYPTLDYAVMKNVLSMPCLQCQT